MARYDARKLRNGMKYEISNEYLKVKADTEGAILWSVTDKDGFEYIWQGDDRYWNEHGANLFPYIARLWEKSYIFQGKTYHMDIHGFAKDSVFSCEKAGENELVFVMEDTRETLEQYPSYYTPITAQEGALIVNTEMMKENNLPMPKSIKDLANPEYKGFISVTDIEGSSTAWLMIQALISSYGEDQTKEILKKIYENAGPHLEDSGSGPLKKVRAGEVAIGFGLRHQAIADKNNGLPIDYVDPTEGNYVLTESLALINKDGNENPLASEMADCIINKGRAELIKTYPMALYEGENTDSSSVSGNTKVFAEKLTVDLLDKHKKLSNECKGEN